VSSGGVAIQTWGSQTDECIASDPETGKAVPCTLSCEVLAHTRPEFDLVDDSNPATGGVILRHSGLVPAVTDKFGCQTDPRTGYPRERTLDMILQCDPTMSRNQIVPVSFVEPVSGSCQYQFTLRTGAACGIDGDPFDLPTTQATPGSNFGYVVLGAVLCVSLQFATAWASARGYFSHLPSIPGLSSIMPSAGSSSSTGLKSMGTTSSASATAPATSGGFQSSGGYGSL
jgi:hypothetical protein